MLVPVVRISAVVGLFGIVPEKLLLKRIYHLDRGYERFEERLRSLGADVERLPASALPKGFAED